MRRGFIVVFLMAGAMIVGCLGFEDPVIDTDYDQVPDDEDPDDDDDCIPDDWEILYGLDPLDNSDKYQDMDNDGVDNKNEYDTSTDPTDPNDYSRQMKENITRYGIPLYVNASYDFDQTIESDFDDDGIPDEIERALLMDPTNPEDAWMDWDSDGISNKAEIEIGRDPLGG